MKKDEGTNLDVIEIKIEPPLRAKKQISNN